MSVFEVPEKLSNNCTVHLQNRFHGGNEAFLNNFLTRLLI